MIKAIQKFLDNRKRTVSIRFKCTAAQAQEAKTRLQALADLMVAAERLNELWRPDFYNYEQPKYFHSYDRMKGEIIIDTTWRYDHGKVYFKSKEAADKAVEMLGEVCITNALAVALYGGY